jgi:predicted nicotinamide N-methyase
VPSDVERLEAEPAAHVRLLRAQPVIEIAGPDLVAHHAADVFALWERWETSTASRRDPPFWAVVWPGAAVLSRFLLAERERVRGRRVIDLGCGSGVVAIAGKKAGARSVVAIDGDPAAVDAARVNCRLNGVSIETRVGDASQWAGTFRADDVVTLSEMFYDEPGSILLSEMADQAVARGATVLVADGERKFLPHSKLRKLREELVRVDTILEGVTHRRVGVFEWLS